MKLMKNKLGIAFISAGAILLLFFGSDCKNSSNSGNDMLLLLGALKAGGGGASENPCKNKTGLVICIPPGLRF